MSRNRSAKKISSKVLYVMNEHPETRNSDRKLIAEIYKMYGVSNRPFDEVLAMKDLPKFESIRRARQKIQEEFPMLRAVPEVENARIAEQEDYIEFAREGVM